MSVKNGSCQKGSRIHCYKRGCDSMAVYVYIVYYEFGNFREIMIFFLDER